MRTPRFRVGVGPLLVLMLAGCSDPITGVEHPNAPPDTRVTATPPALSATDYTVSFFWTGSDTDGTIEAYQWRISDNGEDGVVDVGDTLSESLPWNFTTHTDSTFLVTADLPGFDDDVSDDLPPDAVRYWQTHTFFVRSVDDDGMVDQTPAHVSFTAVTLAPTVAIVLPSSRQPDDCSPVPPAMSFAWEGTDPDSEQKQPEEYRYLLKRYGEQSEPCLRKAEFERGEFPITNDDKAWSDWIRRDAALDSGTIVRFPAVPESGLAASYIFAVQARDKAGAVTPLFEWGRNVRHVQISNSTSPALTVSERFLGTQLFHRTGGSRRFTVTTQQTVAFEWSADASSYGNLIEGYRWGYGLLDPDDPDDLGWTVPWGDGPIWRRSKPTTLTKGAPNFVVQVRDSSGQLSRATYQFEVVQVARRSEQRRLLLVDDFSKSPQVPGSQQIDENWDAGWRLLIQQVGVAGLQSTDVVDATDEARRLSFSLVNDYRSVIWFIGPGPSYFHTRLAPLNRNTPQYNWMEVYQALVGNVLFVGPGAMVSTIEDHSQDYPIILDASGSGSLGLVADGDGERVNAGSLRYPYTAWCLESLDMVRPPRIAGEYAGSLLRETSCSAIVYAGPATEFFDDYDASSFEVQALFPKDLREFGSFKYRTGGLDPTELNLSSLGAEEFYNANVTSRMATINLRDCQVPMYRAITRRDVDEPGIYNDPLAAGWARLGLGVRPAIVDSIIIPNIDPDSFLDDCASQTSRARRDTSPVSLQTIAVASGVFSGYGGTPSTKQNGTLRASDFLWGFNPLQFQSSGVGSALRWIIIDHWGVNADF